MNQTKENTPTKLTAEELEMARTVAKATDDRLALLLLSHIEAQEAELIRFQEALTANEGTKAEYMGEFHFSLDGDIYAVPWTTIKKIMAAILERASTPHQQTLKGGVHNETFSRE